ncbi:MAG: hypothetical protein AAGB19_04075 [Cyanobacteria bacterium P01_F01_bin.3]
MTPQQLSRYFLSAAAIAVLSVACSSGLRDYTQVTLEITDVPEATEEVDTDILAEAQTAVEKRLTSLNVNTAEINVAEPNQVIVRLPQDADAQTITSNLVQPSQLTLRNQKPDTEEALAENIETLQRLLVEQNTLIQTNAQADAAALQPQIDETRTAILDLFEPGNIDSTMLLDAQAVQLTGFNVWEIRIWFDAQGTDQFAQQTKAMAGTGRTIGIFLDDVLLSTPIVPVEYAETGIPDGEATISGNFTAEAAKDLERQLKIGALPVDLDIVNMTTSNDPEPTEDTEEKGAEEKEAEGENAETEAGS